MLKYSRVIAHLLCFICFATPTLQFCPLSPLDHLPIRSEILSKLDQTPESGHTYVINITDIYYNCIAKSPQIGLYSFITITADFNLDSAPLTLFLQLDFECSMTTDAYYTIRYSSQLFNVTETPQNLTRTNSYTHDICTKCSSLADNINHCIPCSTQCDQSYFGYCTSVGSEDCCEVVVQNTTCSTQCPDRHVPDINHRCICDSYWTGDNCSTCEFPCLHGGTPTNYCNSCFCSQGYTGNNCSDEIDYCEHNTCPINSYCTNSPHGYDCVCKQGYAGSDCASKINYCLSNPCNNSGVCTSYLTGFVCTCHPGFTGVTCDISVDLCLIRDPCLNNGTCYTTQIGAVCNCVVGYTGFYCQNETNYCESNPCQGYNSNCSRRIGGYDCSCEFPRTGINCETEVDYCTPYPCNISNTNTCLTEVGGPQCLCKDGFNGERCENNINDCMANVCGNGVCIDGVSNYTCECYSGFNGSACDSIDVKEVCRYIRCENNGTCNENYFSISNNLTEISQIISSNGSYDQQPNHCKCLTSWGGVMCESCHLNCTYENSIDSSDCSICECNNLWEGDNCRECPYLIERGECVKNCSLPNFQISDNKSCFACGLQNCIFCNVSHPEECTECEQNFTLNSTSKECEPEIDITTTGTPPASNNTDSPSFPTLPPFDFPTLSFGFSIPGIIILFIIIIIILWLCCACRKRMTSLCCLGGGKSSTGSGPSWWGWGSQGRKQKINIHIDKKLDDDDVTVKKGRKIIKSNKKRRKRAAKRKQRYDPTDIEKNGISLESISATSNTLIMSKNVEKVEFTDNPFYQITDTFTPEPIYEFKDESQLATPINNSSGMSTVTQLTNAEEYFDDVTPQQLIYSSDLNLDSTAQYSNMNNVGYNESEYHTPFHYAYSSDLPHGLYEATSDEYVNLNIDTQPESQENNYINIAPIENGFDYENYGNIISQPSQHNYTSNDDSNYVNITPDTLPHGDINNYTPIHSESAL